MRIIKRPKLHKHWTQIENKIWTLGSISEGAKCLYGFLCSIPLGKNVTDGYIIKCTGMTQRTITRRKQELKQADLLYVVQLAPKVYEMYLGAPSYPASQVKKDSDENTNT